MPTTKRLMTDTTGQDIVQAIEDLSIAIKPNATDIHMSSSDSTSVAQKINNEIATVADGIAIVAEGDVHAAIAKGQFVYVRNHSTLAQGVYKATAAIGTNATLSTSNLTLDNGGGLNDLQAQITSLNSKLTQQNMFVKASGIINATSYTFDVPELYCCGLFVTNINGVGNTIGYFKCDNGTVTISRFDDTSLYLNVSYSDKKITFTNTAGTSIRDITIIIG